MPIVIGGRFTKDKKRSTESGAPLFTLAADSVLCTCQSDSTRVLSVFLFFPSCWLWKFGWHLRRLFANGKTRSASPDAARRVARSTDSGA